MKKHPIQPLVEDSQGVLRFQANAIVKYMTDQVGLNKLASMDFPREDWDQLAQLIGYSHSGSPSYLSDETWTAAQQMHDEGASESDARYESLRSQLQELAQLLDGASECFERLDKIRDANWND